MSWKLLTYTRTNIHIVKGRHQMVVCSKIVPIHCFHSEEKSEKHRSTADTDVLAYLEAKQQSQDRLRERERDLKEKELELQTARFKLERRAGNSVKTRDGVTHGDTAALNGS